MTSNEALDIACKAIVLAMMVRWLFPIDIHFRWVFSAAVVGMMAHRGMFTTAHPVSSLPVSDLFLATGVVLAFVGVTQVIRKY